MPIQSDRISADIAAISRITQTPGQGATRPTFSNEWGQARDYVIGQAVSAGCHVRIDAAGNVHIRPAQLSWDTPAWLSGSHVDTVPHGGDYDGVVGVIAPLEVLRAAHEDGRSALLELVIWAEEEGPTFGLGMLGSRAHVGELSADRLGELRNAQNQSYLEAGARFGVQPNLIATDRVNPATIRGLIELHIEQGPGMWKRDEHLAVVTAIAGRRQYKCSFAGVANHAGSTSMADRADALAGAASAIHELERLALDLASQTVITVGRIENFPNAINVIPDRVDFTIDFRSPDNNILTDGDARLRHTLSAISLRRNLKVTINATESIPAVQMDASVCDRLRDAADFLNIPNVATTTSGALHDAAVLAPFVPTAMLFVPSRDGISHNPAEFSRTQDVTLAAQLLAETVKA